MSDKEPLGDDDREQEASGADCGHCEGTGKNEDGTDCMECEGTGKEE